MRLRTVLLLACSAWPALADAQAGPLGDRWRWVRQTLPTTMAPQGAWGLTEVSDSLIWVASDSAVLWFDGYFWHGVPWIGPRPDQPPQHLVAWRGGAALLAHNSLFLATREAVRPDPLLDQRGRVIVEGLAAPHPDTLLVLARAAGGWSLFQRTADSMRAVEPPAPLGGLGVARLEQGQWGAVWLNTTAGLYRWRPGGWDLVFPASARPLAIAAIGNGPDGEILVSLQIEQGQGGLWQVPPGRGPRQIITEGINPALSIAVGPGGEATIVYQTGDVRIRGRDGVWGSISRPPEALQDVRLLAYRPDGNLWVVSGEDLYLFRAAARRWSGFVHPFPDLRNRVHEILHRADGSLWLATADGIEIVTGGTRRWLRNIHGDSLGTVTGLAEDSAGGVWVTSGSSFTGAWRFADERWTRVEVPGAGPIHRVTVDPAGVVWLAALRGGGDTTMAGGAWRWDGRTMERVGAEALDPRGVRGIAFAADGSVWFAHRGGLSRLRDGQWTRWSEWRGVRDTLPFRVAIDPFDVAVDRAGRVWFAEQRWGLGLIDGDALTILGEADGVLHRAVQSVVTAPDGALWVATRGGVGRYDGAVWWWFTSELGLASPFVWPVRPHGDHVHVGTLGSGAQTLSLVEGRHPPPRVHLLRPTVDGRDVTLRWQTAAWWGHLPSGAIETRWRLDGGPWSPWSTVRVVPLQGATGGRHLLQVQAKGWLGTLSGVERQEFAVPRPLVLQPGFAVPMVALSAALVLVGVAAVRRKRRADRALRASEERFRHMIEHAAELILLLQADGVIKYVSPSVQRMLGWEAESVPGRSVFAFIHPDDLPVAQAKMQQALARPGEAVRFDVRALHRDGRVVWVEVSGTNLLGDPSVGAVVVNTRDVTERTEWERGLRESEAAYRGLVQHATYGIFRSTPDGRFLTVNPALVDLLGFASSEELMAVSLASLYVDPAQRPALIERLSPLDRIENVEVAWRTRDGEPIVVKLSGRPVRHGGMLEAFEIIVENVTERRALEAQLRQAQKMEAVGQLTAGLAHDFNNLLTAVLTNAELLSETVGPDAVQAREDLAEIKRAVLQGAALVRKLMAFSRRDQLAVRPLDLAPLVDDLVSVLRRVLPESIDLRVERIDAAVILGDRGALEQILLNLANNARDAMPGGGTLTFTLDTVSRRQEGGVRRPGPWARLRVADSGTGMDAVTMERIFEPFFTTKPSGEGTGLGMAMVYGLTQQLGGTIAVASAHGQGTTVTLAFPLHRAAPTRDRDDHQPAAAPRGSERILLVEDDGQIRRGARAALERAGYAVEVAADGEEALRTLERGTPIDLVVADVVMPRMGGRELLRATRARGRDVAFIYVSGYTGDAADDPLDPSVPLLPKPWTMRDLLATVRRVLDRARTTA